MLVREGRSASRMRVMMLGLRGIPQVQGGVESHVEELAQRLVRRGIVVEVLARRPYVARKTPHRWRGLVIVPLPAPRSRWLEALVHTFIGIVYAARRRPDILHIHAVGPSLLVPMARALGLNVVVTHHGYDYERSKWGPLARTLLRLGEWAGMRFADRRIAVSNGIARSMRHRYGVLVAAVPNGVSPQAPPRSMTALRRFDLYPGRYIVMISRLVPEKRHLDLIEAFARSALDGWKLVLVGSADHENTYSRLVLAAAETTPGVVATGFQSGLALRELRGHAGLFVLPSSHEGLPIALLEALSDGLPVIASDIPANREIGLPDDSYVPVGDVDALANAITRACLQRGDEAERARTRARVSRDFDWDSIAEQIRGVYATLREQVPLEDDPPGITPLPRPSR